MNKKNIDIPKIIIVSIITLIVLIIAISLLIDDINDAEKSGLYKNETYISEIFSNYEDDLKIMTDKDFYLYDDQEISIFDYQDYGNKNGIRLYDEGYQKDNDIIKLIPKDFFFTISPNGKHYLGEKYGFYIKTIKDLEENALDNAGYNSDNYYKSIVVVYALEVKLPSLINNNTDGYSCIRIIAEGEYHSYKQVSDAMKENLPDNIISDIEDKGVVTYYSNLEGKDIAYSQYEYKLELSNDTGYVENNDVFQNNENALTGFGFESYVYYNIKPKDNNIRNVMRLSIVYDFKIYDNIWLDQTKKAGTIVEVHIEKQFAYTYKSQALELGTECDFYYYKDLNYVIFSINGNNSAIKVELLNSEEFVICYIRDGEFHYIEYNNGFFAETDIVYYICVYNNGFDTSTIKLTN